MAKAEEFQVVNPNLCVWSAFCNEAKVDLTSAAYIHEGSMVLVDPIGLAEAAWNDLLKFGAPRAVLLTNGNHLRSAMHYRALCRIPVVSSVEARHENRK